jgi:hypothetical protein
MKEALLKNDYNSNQLETEIDLLRDNKNEEKGAKRMIRTKRTSTLRETSMSFDSEESNFNNNNNGSLINDASLIQQQPIKLQNLNQSSNISPQSVKSIKGVNLNGSATSALLCRICYAADNTREPLMQPCACSGTMGLMHRTCLEKWLSQSNSHSCEICHFEFTIEKRAKSFGAWLCRPLTTKDTKNLFNDFVCFLILTPLAYVTTWYCVLFSLRFHQAAAGGNKWEASGLVVLTTFLLLIYLLWLMFSCKYHLRVLKEWQAKNQIVTLKINEENMNTLKLVDINRLNSQNQLQIIVNAAAPNSQQYTEIDLTNNNNRA